MTSKQKIGTCKLSAFEKRLYCGKKRVNNDCTHVSFLKHRCTYLSMSKDEVMKAVKAGIKEINVKGGFSSDAIEYANKYRPELRLRQGEKIIKPRRKIRAVAS